MQNFEAFSETIRQNRQSESERLVVPICKRKSADLLTPVSAFLLIGHGDPYAFLLESVEGGEKLARYSFIGRRPSTIVRADGKHITVEDASGVSTRENATVFDVLKARIGAYREIVSPGLPRFAGGAVGYLAYDTVRTLERLPDSPEDDLGVPDGVWAFYDTIAAFDHVKHQLLIIGLAFIDPDTDLQEAYAETCRNIDELETLLGRASLPHPEPVRLTGELSSNARRPDFESAVERAKEYIREGDIFQVVLSQRFEVPFEGDPFNLYRALRQVNPSPYLFFLKFPDFSLVGSSPEVLVRVEGANAELLPIAGTRPRGQSSAEDAALETDLLDDPKEMAEHVMLVDLGRNDLSRVAEFGSVHVDRYAYIERFSHVMHIVSSVSATLDLARDSIDVLAACFPAGTVSGAPKVRAMEIIDELESARRGVYAGAVGYLNYSGDLDTCITIRTMLVSGGTAYVQAGAGIVADSDPAREYDETVNKARALQVAIRVAATELL